MKFLVTLVVLCTTLFVMLDTAPVFPFGFKVTEQQRSDEMAKTFLNVFSKFLTAAGGKISRDGSIQADNEARRIILSDIGNIFSALTKNITAAPNDEVGQTFIKGANSIVSVIRKQLDDEGAGHIQSEDESLQTVMNFIGALLPGKMKKTASGDVHVQSVHRNEVGLTMVNATLDLLSALIKNTDPNDELQQTVWNGARTLISLGGKQLKQEGGIQSIDDEMNQALTNLLISILSGVKKTTHNGEAHSAADDFNRTFLNILKIMLSVMQRAADPSDEKMLSFMNTIFTLLVSDGEPNDDELKTLMNQLCSLLSALTNKIESGEIQSADEVTGAVVKLFSDILSIASKKIDPDDDMAQSFFSSLSTIISLLGRKINSGGNQIPSDIDNELAKTVINLIDTFTSEFQKAEKEKPNDEVLQLFLTCFNRTISAVKNKIGRGAQEDTLPTYTAKRFDQIMSMESVDENAAMVESGIALSEKAMTQLWGAILSSLASGLSNKSLHG